MGFVSQCISEKLSYTTETSEDKNMHASDVYKRWRVRTYFRALGLDQQEPGRLHGLLLCEHHSIITVLTDWLLGGMSSLILIYLVVSQNGGTPI